MSPQCYTRETNIAMAEGLAHALTANRLRTEENLHNYHSFIVKIYLLIPLINPTALYVSSILQIGQGWLIFSKQL